MLDCHRTDGFFPPTQMRALGQMRMIYITFNTLYSYI